MVSETVTDPTYVPAAGLIAGAAAWMVYATPATKLSVMSGAEAIACTVVVCEMTIGPA